MRAVTRSGPQLRLGLRRIAILIAALLSIALFLPLLRLPTPAGVKPGASTKTSAVKYLKDDGETTEYLDYYFYLATMTREDIPTDTIAQIRLVSSSHGIAAQKSDLPANGTLPTKEEALRVIRNAFDAFCAERGCTEVPKLLDKADSAPIGTNEHLHAVHNDHRTLLLWRDGLQLTRGLAILIAIGAFIYACSVLLPAWRNERRRNQFTLCRRCGYDLRGSLSICPECGGPGLADLPHIPRSQLKNIAANARRG